MIMEKYDDVTDKLLDRLETRIGEKIEYELRERARQSSAPTNALPRASVIEAVQFCLDREKAHSSFVPIHESPGPHEDPPDPPEDPPGTLPSA